MTFETFDQNDEETWPDKKRQWQRQIHLESTFKERPWGLVTFETFDQSDEEPWYYQKNDNDNNKYKDKDNDEDKDKYI